MTLLSLSALCEASADLAEAILSQLDPRSLATLRTASRSLRAGDCCSSSAAPLSTQTHVPVSL